jgi:hypothetical protein
MAALGIIFQDQSSLGVICPFVFSWGSLVNMISGHEWSGKVKKGE